MESTMHKKATRWAETCKPNIIVMLTAFEEGILPQVPLLDYLCLQIIVAYQQGWNDSQRDRIR